MTNELRPASKSQRPGRVALALLCSVVFVATPVANASAFGFGFGFGGFGFGGGHFGGFGGGHYGGHYGYGGGHYGSHYGFGGSHYGYGGGHYGYGGSHYGFGGSHYGFGGSHYGFGSHGPSYNGGHPPYGMAMNGPMTGRSSGYAPTHPNIHPNYKPEWHPAERAPNKPPYTPPHPPVYGGIGIHHGGPWHHPIYGGYTPPEQPVTPPPVAYVPPVETPPPPPPPVYSAPSQPTFGGGQPVRSFGGDFNPPPQQNQQPPEPPVMQTAQRAQSGVPAANENRFVPDEVMFTVSGTPQVAESIGLKHNLVLVSSHNLGLIGGGTLNRYKIADNRSVPDVIRDLETEQQITWAQPNYIYQLEGIEMASSLSGAQYMLSKMHLNEAHRVTEGEKTLVAVIDSGIDETHPEIAGSVVDRFDTLGGTMQAHSHGTAIAGAISAHGALVGAAPHTNILAIRAFDGSTTKAGADGTTAHIVEGLNWAHEHHAQIVNMSFAGAFDPLLALAINTAHQQGMIIVAAAGNDGPNAAPAYPAADENVIAVTATDRDNNLFSGSNHGSYICLSAPGTDIIAAAPSNSYQFSTGTSIAAAHISGLVALLLSEKPDLSADAVRDILKQTAQQLGTAGSEEAFGAGLGDAQKAVALVDGQREQASMSNRKTTNVAEARTE